MKFGNTRIDAAGGFQQYLVLLSRLVTGQVTSSVTDKTTELGKGFKAKTRMGLLYDFGVSKLHPTAKWAWDLLNASEYKPFNFGDRTAQLYIPMILGDLAQIAREDPSLLPVGLMTGVGWGTQTYEKGQPERVFIPEEYDTEPFTGGALPF